jgi:hypothetical protein
MFLTVVLFITTLAATLIWMAKQNDQRAVADSARMVTGGVDELHRKTSIVAADYALWKVVSDQCEPVSV